MLAVIIKDVIHPYAHSLFSWKTAIGPRDSLPSSSPSPPREGLGASHAHEMTVLCGHGPGWPGSSVVIFKDTCIHASWMNRCIFPSAQVYADI